MSVSVEAAEPQPRPRRRWKMLAWQLAITVAFAVGAALTVDFGMLIDALRGVRWWLMLPALFLFTFAKFIDAWRWRYLLQGLGDPPPHRALFGAFLIGNIVNNLLPLRAGDVAKVQVLANRYGTSRAGLAASVFVVEATLDAVVFLILVTTALLFSGRGAGTFGLNDTQAQGLALLTALALATSIAALVLARGRGLELLARATPRRFRPRVRGWLEAAREGLHALRSWRRTAGAIALSLPSWLVEAAMFAVIGRAFGLDLGYPAFLAIMVAANLAVALPFGLWNFGPYEVLVTATAVAAGGDQATALAYAVTIHIATNAWIVVTGAIAFWLMRIDPRELLTTSSRVPAGEGAEPTRTTNRSHHD